MKTYNEMADDVFRRYDEYTEKMRKRNAVLRKAGGICCICLVALVGTVFLKGRPDNAKLSNDIIETEDMSGEYIGDYHEVETDTDGVPVDEYSGPSLSSALDTKDAQATAGSEAMATSRAGDGNMWLLGPGDSMPQMKELISSLPGIEDEYSYTTPKNGEVNMTKALETALLKYKDEDVIFRISVDLFSNEVQLQNNSEAVKSELARLGSLGYVTALNIFSSPDRTVYTVEMHLGPSQFEDFPASDGIGYMMYLFDEYAG